jgi:hypothetical protein
MRRIETHAQLSLFQTGKRREYMDDNPMPMLTSIGALRGSITVSAAIDCATASCGDWRPWLRCAELTPCGRTAHPGAVAAPAERQACDLELAPNSSPRLRLAFRHAVHLT